MKHSSRLILKISYFIISSSMLLIAIVVNQRNKIRFVARIHVEFRFDNSSCGYCTKQEMFFQQPLWLLYRDFFFSGPSGYCFRFSLSVALLVTVLGQVFFFSTSSALRLLNTAKYCKIYLYFLLAIPLLNFVINLIYSHM